MNDRIRCPYCGSTAQTKLIKSVKWQDRNLCRITDHYECGCGCSFNRKYQLYDIEIEKLGKNS